MRRTVEDSERGAVAVLFGILLGSGVLISLLIIVSDLGQAYVGRRVAQDVADLSAMSVAAECMVNPSDCTNSSTLALATSVASANAVGKRVSASVSQVCTPLASGCPPLTNSKGECNATTARNFVRVYTTGSSSLGSNAVPLDFAPILGGPDRLTLRACAQAGWAQVSGAPIDAPLAFSICDFSLTQSRQVKEWTTGNAGCSISDLDGVSQPGNFTGFLPLQRDTDWFDSTCSKPVVMYVNEAVSWERSDICRGLVDGTVSGFEAALTSMLNRPRIVAIVRYTDNRPVIAAFAQYVLKAFKYGSKPTVGEAVTWTGSCVNPGNPVAGGKCVYGTFVSTSLPYAPYSFNVPNLGISTLVPLP